MDSRREPGMKAQPILNLSGATYALICTFVRVAVMPYCALTTYQQRPISWPLAGQKYRSFFEQYFTNVT
ncbi:hypothetical protein IMCC3135_28725 [Granulosicoccus antarcticus IMCC3135]|uniref:Uncharacterized protein n=1 Tax=Granulosicoccus antarcticus IMCC3135 TaxID=1192854 RepID=A0A2Z2P538_9GAMM|nr:hypothetical protein IMCC3135_28725 [Granulosicoccus antarcticus IMCC3135]